MNKVPLPRPRNALWLAAIAFLVLLQFWWIPGQTYRASDSYSIMSDGKLGLFRVLVKLFPDVAREANTLVPVGPQTMILIDPPADLDRNARTELGRFVSLGGTLVFAPGFPAASDAYDEWGFNFHWIGGKVPTGSGPSNNKKPNQQDPIHEQLEKSKSRREGNSRRSESAPPVLDETTDNTEIPVGQRSALSVTGSIVDGACKWEADREIKPRLYFDHTNLLTDGEGRIHASAISVGQGDIIVCTSPEAFSNKAMLDPDRAELAVRLIEYADRLNKKTNRNAGGIVICEHLNDTRTGDVWGILFGPALRHGSLQIVLIGILIAWLGYEQFGPHRKRSRSGRKSLTDAAEALGNLQFRTKNGAQVLARYFDYVTMYARRGSGHMANLQSSEWLAGRTGLPIDEVKSQLLRIERVLKSGNESPANVASMIRWLANVQQRLSHPLSKRKK